LNTLGGTIDVSNVVVYRNLANGGAGADGANGGNALGGGIHNLTNSSMTIRRSAIVDNRARGAAAGAGGVDGQGIGGGIYVASGTTVCVDALAAIFGNDASTSDEDVFGSLCFI
jgi:hypothetical protein